MSESKPTVKIGDQVEFVNAGKVSLGTLKNLHPSGHGDIEYRSEDPTIPGLVEARGIPQLPADGSGSHGWRPKKAAPAAAPAEAE